MQRTTFHIDDVIPYDDALQQMEALKEKAPSVWFLQHPHMYSLGNRGKISDINNIYHLPVYTSSRGGQVTYHGPGQLIAYCFFDLKQLHMTIHDYVSALEHVVVQTLQHFNIQGHKGGHPGIWVGDAKIASIGVRVQRRITSHGFALNVCNDLKYFDPIRTCGMVDAQVTSMEQYCKNITVKEVTEVCQSLLLKGFS